MLKVENKENVNYIIYRHTTPFKTFISAVRCAEFFNVIPATINNIVRGRTKTLKKKIFNKI